MQTVRRPPVHDTGLVSCHKAPVDDLVNLTSSENRNFNRDIRPAGGVWMSLGEFVNAKT
jgi:hypothetical protein